MTDLLTAQLAAAVHHDNPKAIPAELRVLLEEDARTQNRQALLRKSRSSIKRAIGSLTPAEAIEHAVNRTGTSTLLAYIYVFKTVLLKRNIQQSVNQTKRALINAGLISPSITHDEFVDMLRDARAFAGMLTPEAFNLITTKLVAAGALAEEVVFSNSVAARAAANNEVA